MLDFMLLSGIWILVFDQLYLQVVQEINSEAKFQSDFLNQLVSFPFISYYHCGYVVFYFVYGIILLGSL
jgi:hypothetical protein